MIGTIAAYKEKHSQAFTDKGKRIVTTSLHVVDTYITGVRTKEKHGYWALELAYNRGRSVSCIKKPLAGKLKKAGIDTPLRFFKEIRINELKNKVSATEEQGALGLKIGDKIFLVGTHFKPTDLFKIGDSIVVIGTSKGKGFQGVVKRHRFAGGPKTHGQSDRHRAPGSIGAGTTPGRVHKGKKMAGRMGGKTITIKGLKIIDVSDEKILVQGLVPGGPKSQVFIKA